MEHHAPPAAGRRLTPAAPRERGLLAAGLLVGLFPLVAGHLPAADDAARLNHLLWGYAAAALPYAYVAWRWTDLHPERAGLGRLLTTQLVVRLGLLTLPPLLSEDVWRYVWDGAVQWAGMNPYRYAPESAELDYVVVGDPRLAAVRAEIGHAHIPTIYPPAAQVIFAAGTALVPHPLVLRIAAVAADLAVTAGIWIWARRLGRRPQAAALYALSPLAALETAVGAHVDIFGVAALVAGGALLTGGRPLRAGLALAIGAGTKLLPLLALPKLALRAPRAVLSCGVAVLLLALPYLGAGQALLGGLTAYGHRWRGNDGAFRVLLAPFEAVWPSAPHPIELPDPGVRLVRALVGTPPGVAPADVWPDEVSFAAAKLTVALLFGGFLLYRLWRARELIGFLGPVIAALLLLSPVVHPWYLLWLLPFCALALARPGAAWPWPLVLWTALACLAYHPRPEYLRTGEWAESPFMVWAQYSPVWIGLAVAGLRGLVRRRVEGAGGTPACGSRAPGS